MKATFEQINQLIDNSNSIPNPLKPVVKAICRGYHRQISGRIPLEGYQNMAKATISRRSESDPGFNTDEHVLGYTHTHYNEDCTINHRIEFLGSENIIKVLAILSHEIGHVITESNPTNYYSGKFPYVKRTAGYYSDFEQVGDSMYCSGDHGHRVSDGFLESVCTKMWASPEFRKEMSILGFDLKDYQYKDPRLFPSRSYDEYKAGFELFDYVSLGAITDFACKSFPTNGDMLEFIEDTGLDSIYYSLDQSDRAFSDLKIFEGKPSSPKFVFQLKRYQMLKKATLKLAKFCADVSRVSETPEYKKLYEAYSNTLSLQKLLPLNDSREDERR